MKKEWAIQQFNQELKLWEFVASTDRDQLLTREEMLSSLKMFEKDRPNVDFRGHNWINNEIRGSDHYE